MRTRTLVMLPAIVLTATLAVPAVAHAATVDGCPKGDWCDYASKLSYYGGIVMDSFSLGKPVPVGVYDTGAQGVYAVADSSTEYTSEGHFVAEIPGVLCEYVPHAKDEQNPGTTQVVTVDHFHAVAYGTSQSAVDSTSVVPVTDCN
jgi:hypothetical protein